MLLAVGVWVAVLGYTGLRWGVDVFSSRPTSFGYLLGLSTSPPGPLGQLPSDALAPGYPQLQPPTAGKGQTTRGNTGSPVKPYG